MNNLTDTFYEIEELNNDDFLKLKETLTRIGIPARFKTANKVLFQTAHILHKQGKYYLVHFKQLFLLDGKIEKTNFTEQDKMRLAKIVNMLQEWGLIKIKKSPKIDFEIDDALDIPLTVVTYKNKSKWELESKYDIGIKYDRK